MLSPKAERWMRGGLRSGLFGLLVLALPGCEGVREQLGLGKRPPDEFAVVTKAPLALPPEFTLRPPKPGAPRPQEQQPSEVARGALTQGRAGRAVPSLAAGRGAGEQALLKQAGAERADPKIREVVNRESSQFAEREVSFADKLIFWRAPEPPGSAVDPQKEAQRLRDNAAQGKTVTEGETPVIKRRQRGLLEGIF
jgi:hypothetical protein